MINVYVIRHGETDFSKDGKYLGRTDISLNDRGIKQAQELAEKVGNFNIEVIYCSPLKRAIETVNYINEKQNCDFIIIDDLTERSMGVYEGLTKEEAEEKYPELYAKNITRIFNNTPPQGETVNDVIKRVSDVLNKMKKENKYSNILISTHGFVAKVINKYFNKDITEEDFFNFALKNGEIKRYFL